MGQGEDSVQELHQQLLLHYSLPPPPTTSPVASLNKASAKLNPALLEFGRNLAIFFSNAIKRRTENQATKLELDTDEPILVPDFRLGHPPPYRESIPEFIIFSDASPNCVCSSNVVFQ